MFSAMRRRISPATVLAGLALVFAMSGGAYAAKKYLITSTKQISPSVLKQLQGKAGSGGAPGAAGAQGAQGPAGPAGPGGSRGFGWGERRNRSCGRERRKGLHGCHWRERRDWGHGCRARRVSLRRCPPVRPRRGPGLLPAVAYEGTAGRREHPDLLPDPAGRNLRTRCGPNQAGNRGIDYDAEGRL